MFGFSGLFSCIPSIAIAISSSNTAQINTAIHSKVLTATLTHTFFLKQKTWEATTMYSHCLLINSSKKYYETLFVNILVLPILNFCNNTVAHHTGDIRSWKQPLNPWRSFSFVTESFLISSTCITFLHSSCSIFSTLFTFLQLVYCSLHSTGFWQ